MRAGVEAWGVPGRNRFGCTSSVAELMTLDMGTDGTLKELMSGAAIEQT